LESTNLENITVNIGAATGYKAVQLDCLFLNAPTSFETFL